MHDLVSVWSDWRATLGCRTDSRNRSSAIELPGVHSAQQGVDWFEALVVQKGQQMLPVLQQSSGCGGTSGWELSSYVCNHRFTQALIGIDFWTRVRLSIRSCLDTRQSVNLRPVSGGSIWRI